MPRSVRSIRDKYGMVQRPVTDGMALPRVTTREELDAMAEIGIAEMQRDGYSKTYVQWTELLRRGADQLPSLRDFEGMATDGQNLIRETLAAAHHDNRVFEKLDPRLEGMEIHGKPIEDCDPRRALEALSIAMTEVADGPARNILLDKIEAINNSVTSSNTSVSITMPDPSMTVHVESDREETGDPYVDARNRAMNPQGLDGMFLPSNGYDSNGLKGTGAGGGQYSVAHDAALQQALAEEAEYGEEEDY